MPVDITDWIARQTVESADFPEKGGGTTTREIYKDLGGNLAARIIQEKFPDYLSIPQTVKVTGKDPESGAVASYSPLSGNITPPKGGEAIEWQKSSGKRSTNDFWGDGATTDEVINTTFVMLHELTHARSPLTTSAIGSPSDQAIKDLMKSAVASNKFRSQGESGALDELVASLLPIRDMNARGIRPNPGTIAGDAQQGYDKLVQDYTWLPSFLDAQSQPEKKQFRTSPQIQNSPPKFSEVISSSLKSLFSFGSKKPGE